MILEEESDSLHLKYPVPRSAVLASSNLYFRPPAADFCSKVDVGEVAYLPLFEHAKNGRRFAPSDK